LSFCEVITETGINIILIQKGALTQKIIDTAYVVSIIRGIIIALIIAVFAYPVAWIFQSPEAASIIMWIAIVPLIKGFINPSIVSYIKNLTFRYEFYLRSAIYLVESTIAVIATLILSSPLGIVIGMIAGAIVEVVYSHIAISPKPAIRIDITSLKHILSKGKWITATSIFSYLYQYGDNMAVGRLLGSGALGQYDMAYKIAMLPITEIADVFVKTAFPVYKKMKNNLMKDYLRTLTYISILMLSSSLVCYFFADEIVLLLLGPKWSSISEILQALAILGALRGILHTTLAPLYATDKQKVVTIQTGISLSVLLITVVPFIYSFGLLGAAYSATLGTLVAIPYSLWNVIKLIKHEA
jgi:O-antigen/teichoic acid export membrane protein